MGLAVTNLSRLPESIIELGSLKELDLRGNKLTYLPENIGTMKSLESLNAIGNSIEEWPESLEPMRTGQEGLYVTDSYIDRIIKDLILFRVMNGFLADEYLPIIKGNIVLMTGIDTKEADVMMRRTILELEGEGLIKSSMNK